MNTQNIMENGYIINDLSPTHESGYMFTDLSSADDSEIDLDVKPTVRVIEPVSGPQETDPQENRESKALVKLEEIDDEQWSNLCTNLDDPTLSSVCVKTEEKYSHENTNFDFDTVGSLATKTDTVSPQNVTQIKTEENNSHRNSNSNFGSLASNTTLSKNTIIVKQDQFDGSVNSTAKMEVNSVVWTPNTAPANNILTLGDGKVLVPVSNVPSTIVDASPGTVNSTVPTPIIQQPAVPNLIGSNNIKLPTARQKPRVQINSVKRRYTVAELDPIVRKCMDSPQSDQLDSKSDQFDLKGDQFDLKSDQFDLPTEEEISDVKPKPQQLILTIDNEKIIVPNSGQVLLPQGVPIKTENELPVPLSCVKQEDRTEPVATQSIPKFMPHKTWNGVKAVKSEGPGITTNPKFKVTMRKGARKRKLLSHKSWNGLETCGPDSGTPQITTTMSVKRPDEWDGQEVTNVMCVRCRGIFQSMEKLNDHFKKTKHGDVNTYLFSSARWREVGQKKKQEILEACQGNAWICPTPSYLSLGPTIPEQQIPKLVFKCKECGGIYETELEFYTHKTTQNRNACRYRQRLQEKLLQNYESKPVDKALKPLL